MTANHTGRRTDRNRPDPDTMLELQRARRDGLEALDEREFAELRALLGATAEEE